MEAPQSALRPSIRASARANSGSAVPLAPRQPEPKRQPGGASLRFGRSSPLDLPPSAADPDFRPSDESIGAVFRGLQPPKAQLSPKNHDSETKKGPRDPQFLLRRAAYMKYPLHHAKVGRKKNNYAIAHCTALAPRAPRLPCTAQRSATPRLQHQQQQHREYSRTRHTRAAVDCSSAASAAVGLQLQQQQITRNISEQRMQQRLTSAACALLERLACSVASCAMRRGRSSLRCALLLLLHFAHHSLSSPHSLYPHAPRVLAHALHFPCSATALACDANSPASHSRAQRITRAPRALERWGSHD